MNTVPTCPQGGRPELLDWPHRVGRAWKWTMKEGFGSLGLPGCGKVIGAGKMGMGVE